MCILCFNIKIKKEGHSIFGILRFKTKVIMNGKMDWIFMGGSSGVVAPPQCHVSDSFTCFDYMKNIYKKEGTPFFEILGLKT